MQNYRRLPSTGYILTGRFAAAAAKTPQNNSSISKTLASWAAFHGLLKVREGLHRASAAMYAGVGSEVDLIVFSSNNRLSFFGC